MKRCLTLLNREWLMQIKTTMRYHFIPVRITGIKRQQITQWWCGEKRTLMHCWWECKLVQPWQKTLWLFLKKSKIELPFSAINPAIALLSIYSKKMKTLVMKRYMHFYVCWSTIYNNQIWKQLKCPWKDKEDCVCVYACVCIHIYINIFIYTLEYYSAIKMN